MISVQAQGCAPIARAYVEGADHARPWEGAATYASGIRVPSAVGDYLILRAVRESGGTAIAVSEEEIAEGARLINTLEGIFAAPEGGATLAALRALHAQGQVGPNETVVLFNTGTGLKYPLTPGAVE
jgi:threonine synthase